PALGLRIREGRRRPDGPTRVVVQEEADARARGGQSDLYRRHVPEAEDRAGVDAELHGVGRVPDARSLRRRERGVGGQQTDETEDDDRWTSRHSWLLG